MPLSQRSETEPQDLVRLDRHTVLKLYAASLSTTALGTGLHSCASGLHQSAQDWHRGSVHCAYSARYRL
jgi:hypothetical protein